MPRASIVNITVDVKMGPFKHQFVIPTTPARVTEFQWFALLKRLKDVVLANDADGAYVTSPAGWDAQTDIEDHS